jgi:hypothetical protein
MPSRAERQWRRRPGSKAVLFAKFGRCDGPWNLNHFEGCDSYNVSSFPSASRRNLRVVPSRHDIDGRTRGPTARRGTAESTRTCLILVSFSSEFNASFSSDALLACSYSRYQDRLHNPNTVALRYSRSSQVKVLIEGEHCALQSYTVISIFLFLCETNQEA